MIVELEYGRGRLDAMDSRLRGNDEGRSDARAPGRNRAYGGIPMIAGRLLVVIGRGIARHRYRGEAAMIAGKRR